MLKDYFIYVMQHLRRRRLRSWLTLIGIFIGMAAVVSLISISTGLQGAITEQFESLGASRIMISPAGADMGPFSAGLTSVKLTQDDIDVAERVKGVEFVSGFTTAITQIRYRDEVKQGNIMGMPTDQKTLKFFEKIGIIEVDQGRTFKSTSKYEAIIGYSTATKMFERNMSIRDTLMIDDKKFQVVGIQKKGLPGFASQGIFIPKETSAEMFGFEDEVAMISVKVAIGHDPADVAEDLKIKLRRSRNVDEGEEDFSLETSKEVIDSFKQILGAVQALLIGIASISLIVGGVGIMNTMYTAVVERTREIGIMKAIGARNKDVLLIFIIESGSLGLAGGAIGVVLGLGVSKAVEFAASIALDSNLIKADISIPLIIGVLLFSFTLGTLAGFFPARAASRLKPVEALRK